MPKFIGFTGTHVAQLTWDATQWIERNPNNHIDIICMVPFVLPDGEIQVWIAYEECEIVRSDT